MTDTLTFATTDTINRHRAVILADASGGAITLTLPESTTRMDLIIKKTDSSSNAVTVATPGSETIDGQSTISISKQYAERRIVGDGSNYFSDRDNEWNDVSVNGALSGVLHYGFNYGGTDLSDKLSAAFTDAAEGATIHVGLHPSGSKATISSKLTPKDTQNLVGHGQTASKLKHDGSFSDHMLEYADVDDASNSKVREMQLDANKSSRGDTNPTLYLETNADEHIQMVWIANSPGYGIHKVNGWGCWIERCWVETGDDWGIYIESPAGISDSPPSEVRIVDSTIDSNDGGIYVASTAGVKGWIIDADIKTKSSSSRAGINLNVDRYSIAASYLETNNAATGIEANGSRTLVTGCQFVTTGRGVDLNGRRNTVTGCVFETVNPAVRFGTGGYSTAAGNAIENATSGIIDKTTGNAVTGNAFQTVDNYAIWINGSTAGVYSGNTIENAAQSSFSPLRVDGATRPVIVGNNIHQPSTSRSVDAINLIDSDNALVAFNQIHGAGINNHIALDTDCADVKIWQPNLTWSDISDSGTRTVLNGIGKNAGDPSSAGDWNGNGVEGVVVRDTSNTDLYQYINGSWVELPENAGQSYTTSNVTTDRTIDANSTSDAELADVLCTLIADLETAGVLD